MFDSVLVKVKINGSVHDLMCRKGQTLSECMKEQGLVHYSPCSLYKKCGKCTVEFKSAAPLPTSADREYFTPDELRKGYRLACMAKPASPAFVVCNSVPKENILLSYLSERSEKSKSNDVEPIPEEKKGSAELENRKTIVAIDIGTTTIAVKLADVRTGETLREYGVRNPQEKYGMDVIARVDACERGEAELLRKLVVTTLEDCIKRVVGYDNKPLFAVVVANMVMSGILLDRDVSCLGRYPFCSDELCKPDNIIINGITVVIIPGVSAFVGGDCIAGLLFNRFQEQEALSLFIDLGTNAEMVIGNRNRMIGTAAAAGSAFCQSSGNGTCGIDRIADLLERGYIDNTGYLSLKNTITDVLNKNDIFSQTDVRTIQTAKAAIATGIEILCKQMNCSYQDIKSVYLAGGFGFHMNLYAAVRIGLLPANLKNRTIIVGNTAIGGAVYIAQRLEETFQNREVQVTVNDYYDAVQDLLDPLFKRIEILNLAEMPDFAEQYINHINFI